MVQVSICCTQNRKRSRERVEVSSPVNLESVISIIQEGILPDKSSNDLEFSPSL